MSRRWIWGVAAAIAIGAAALAITIAVRESGDDEVIADLPPPASCEPAAADRNADDRTIEPSRGEALIPRREGHLPAGFNDSSHQNGWVTLDEALRLYEAAGMSLTRLPLDWGAVESSPGELDFSEYDEIYCASIAAGVKPVWHLTGIPPWAAPLGYCQEPCVRPPEDEHLPQFKRFAEIAAIRYPRSAAFEVWNEPNLSPFWGRDTPNPADYLPILEAVYEGVKNGNPAMPVLGGALSNNSTDEPDGIGISLRTYLSGMLAGGAAEHMDGLSVHPYPIQPLDEPGDQFTPALATTRELVADAAPGIHIWVTEMGVPTEPGGFAPAFPPDEQAGILRDAFVRLDRASDIDAVLFHALMDAGAGRPGGPGFGFFSQPDAERVVTVKPAVCAIQAALGSSEEPCPSSLQL